MTTDKAAVAVTQHTFCTGMDAHGVAEEMQMAYGKAAHRCLSSDGSIGALGQKKEGEAQLHELLGRPTTLRITGPISDGFWVRVLTVMAHASWARRLGLLISVAYRSKHDAYLDAADQRRDGWTQYFEPVWSDANLTATARGGGDIGARMRSARLAAASASTEESRLVQLDCAAAARAWEAYSNYAPSFRAAALQRRRRVALVRSLPIEPRHSFKQAANSFWQAAGLSQPNASVLGVHLRGTDKPGSKARGVKAFLPLITAYLCHMPHAFIFVATDDASMLADLLAALDGLHVPQARVAWRAEAIRGNSSLNPGFHAQQLDLLGHPSLGRDVLLDTLLLAKSSFLLKSISSVSEFATYWNPRLHEESFDIQLRGQPRPRWANACERRGERAGERGRDGSGRGKSRKLDDPSRITSSTSSPPPPPPPPPSPLHQSARLMCGPRPCPPRAARPYEGSAIGKGVGRRDGSLEGGGREGGGRDGGGRDGGGRDSSGSRESAYAMRNRSWSASASCPRLWVDQTGHYPFRRSAQASALARLTQVDTTEPPRRKRHGAATSPAEEDALRTEEDAMRLAAARATATHTATASSSTVAAAAAAAASSAAAAPNSCASAGEQRSFELQCASTIQQMEALQAETRGRRALIIEYVGRSMWGVGHVMSLAYSAHCA